MKYRDILDDDSQLGPYPLEKLPRVESITTEITGPSQRVRQDSHVMYKLARGEFGQKPKGLTIRNNPMGRSLLDTMNHFGDYKFNPVSANKAPLPEDPHALSRFIKKFTYFLGADMVGITKLLPETVYLTDGRGNPLECDSKFAIVFLLRKEPDTELATHGDEWIDDPASIAVYQRLAVIGITLTDYIRNLGYPAYSSTCASYMTLMPRLIVSAGLGEMSRTGIALNPFVGLAYKAACVLCDLPLEADRPIDFGLQEYCAHCDICAGQCPVQAITYGDKETYNGWRSWKVNELKCAQYCLSQQHSDICQRCSVICPFNRPDNRDFKDWNGSLETLYQAVNAQRDYLASHDYIKQTELSGKWWLNFRFDEQDTLFTPPDYDYKYHYRIAGNRPASSQSIENDK